MKKQAETQIRDAGKVLAELIVKYETNNKPLADRAKALLNDVVELLARIATK
jgi:N-acetylmuramic acid 6-phosphate (MurNAc-6-P) etherase